MNTPDIDAWFCREVLPLEAILMQYLRRNWANTNDLGDLRQDVYIRAYESALHQLPDTPKAFIITIARNLLIDRIRRERVVPIEAVTDLELQDIPSGEVAADRVVIARDSLRRLQIALDRLPPRCREAVVMSKVEGMSRREIAIRMNIAEDTVRQHLIHGMRILAGTLYGEQLDSRRKL